MRASRSCGAATTRGSHSPISRAPVERVRVGRRVVPFRVHRLGAVGERVHRRPDGLLARQRQRQLRLVDGAAEMRARAAALHLPLGVADAEVRRPLGAGIRRRHGDQRNVGVGGDRLAEVDRAAAAERDDAVARVRGGLGDALGRNLRPARGRRESPGACPTSARSRRAAGGRSAARRGRAGSWRSPQRTITPARARAQTRRTRALRASRCGRVARARKISRTGSRPAHARGREQPGREIGLDREPRDERDAVAGEHGAAHRLLQARARAGRRDRAGVCRPCAARPRSPAEHRRLPASRSAARRAAASSVTRLARERDDRRAPRARPRRGRTART